MSIEIQMLVWSMLLGLVHVFAPSTLITRERGVGWNASARDQPMPPPGPLAGRLQRAQSNFMETFPFFAAAVLAVVLTQRQDGMTALAVISARASSSAHVRAIATRPALTAA